MNRSRKKNYNRNVVEYKQDVTTFKIEKEELLLQKKITPNATSDEGVDAVERDENKDDAEDNRR